MDCKDRQLSNAFAGYTATYFSPILISAELSNVKCSANGGGREKLEDEAVTIKIAHAISEVSLVYTVDDQQLEMTVKIPAEYPLKQVEVRDVKRVGVAEDKWRGWLFAAQQIITTQARLYGIIIIWANQFHRTVISQTLWASSKETSPFISRVKRSVRFAIREQEWQ